MTSPAATPRSSASSSTPCSAGSDEPGPAETISVAPWLTEPPSLRNHLHPARAAARAHADRLVALQGLALGLQRGRDHQLGAVELRDVLVAARGHRRAQAAHEVEAAVVLV